MLVSAGLHDAADDAEGQRSSDFSGLLHSNPGHDVSLSCVRNHQWSSVQELLNSLTSSSMFHSLLQKIDFPSMRFTLYFLGYEEKSEIPTDVKERTAWTFSRRATIELTQCVWWAPQHPHTHTPSLLHTWCISNMMMNVWTWSLCVCQ